MTNKLNYKEVLVAVTIAFALYILCVVIGNF